MNKKSLLLICGALFVATQNHAQTCNQSISRTAPDSRYEILSNGAEVKDKQTGLIWQRCSVGQSWDGVTCAYGNDSVTYNWAQAMFLVSKVGNGWRIPNIKELRSIIEEACYKPAINESIFPNTWPDRYYWSSSPFTKLPGKIWTIYLSTGTVSYEDYALNQYAIIMVRDAP